MNVLFKIAVWILIIGGIAWGIEAFEVCIFDVIFGFSHVVETIVDLILGISGIFVAIRIFQGKCCKH